MSRKEPLLKPYGQKILDWLKARKRLRDDLKEWAGIASLLIAILSLIVSSSVAYYTVFRASDDVRVALGFGPEFRHDVKSNALFLHNKVFLTLINAGTRPAAITHVILNLTEPSTKRASAICSKDGLGATMGVFYKFDPFVIKSGEIVTKEVSLGYSDGGMSLLGDTIKAKSDPYYISVCLTFVAVTPDSNEVVADIPVGILQVHKSGHPAVYAIRPRDYQRPIALLPGRHIEYMPSEE